jgi:Undecaprenyl-phosphate glucose phosphotransferase
LGWNQTPSNLIGPSLIYGSVLAGVGVSKRRYAKCATKPRWFAASTAFADNIRAVAVVIAALFILKVSSDVSRAGVICEATAATPITMIARCLWARWAGSRIATGRLYFNRAVILGEDIRLTQVSAAIDLIGRLRAQGVRVHSAKGWPTRPSELVRHNVVDYVLSLSRIGTVDTVVVLPGANNEVAEYLVEAFAETPLTVFVAPLGSAGGYDAPEARIAGLPAIRITNSPLNSLNYVLKRSFDVLLASLMLFLLAPLFLCIALAISMESPGPVFFRQTRHGFGNRHFKVFKFRSMRVMEDGAAFRQATKNDPRVTSVGRFIRKTNLDELPQLINVLLGDMSLVGPRPHPVKLNEEFATRIQHFYRRHNIRPGITGWAQIKGYRGETDTYDKMKSRIEHDLWYVDNWSLVLDIRILINTVFSSTAYSNAA